MGTGTPLGGYAVARYCMETQEQRPMLEQRHYQADLLGSAGPLISTSRPKANRLGSTTLYALWGFGHSILLGTSRLMRIAVVQHSVESSRSKGGSNRLTSQGRQTFVARSSDLEHLENEPAVESPHRPYKGTTPRREHAAPKGIVRRSVLSHRLGSGPMLLKRPDPVSILHPGPVGAPNELSTGSLNLTTALGLHDLHDTTLRIKVDLRIGLGVLNDLLLSQVHSLQQAAPQ